MFQGVYPVSNENLSALPVADVERAVDYYTRVLGFQKLSGDATAAIVKRDAVQLGVVLDPCHDPATAGSCYFEVSDVDALHGELVGAGAKPGPIHTQQHNGKSYRLFFTRECDIIEPNDGYCFCFGKPVEP